MALNQLNVTLGIVTKNFQDGINSVEKSLNRFRRSVESVGQDLTRSITLPLAGLAGASLKSFADLEKASNSLTAVLKGDANAAAVEIEKLRKTAQLPGLGFEEAIQASARLQAVGLTADESRAAIESYGNAVARSGGGRAEFDGAILALTQIASKGKISAEEINQLNERIFEIRPALVAAFGTADSEQLQKLGISAEEFIARTTAELGKLERVTGGLGNAFENFSDSTKTALATLGQEINRAFNVQGLLDKVSGALSRAVDTFRNLDDGTKRAVLSVAAFAAALGPGLILLGQVSRVGTAVTAGLTAINTAFKFVASGALNALTAMKSFSSFAALAFNPTTLAIGAAIGVAVLAYQEFKRRADLANAAQRTLADVSQRATEQIGEEKVRVDLLAKTLTDENAERSAKVRALNELKRINPEYFGQLSVEKSRVEDVTAATKAYIDELKRQAQVKIAIDELARVENQLSNAEELARKGKTTFGQTLTNSLLAAGNAATFAGLQIQTYSKNIAQNFDSLQKQKDALTKLIEELTKQGSTTQTGSGIADSFDRTNKAADKIKDILADVQAGLKEAEQRGLAFGSSFDVAGAKIETLADGIDKLLGAGVSGQSPLITNLGKQIDAIRGQVSTLPPIELPINVQDREGFNIAPAITTATASLEQLGAKALEVSVTSLTPLEQQFRAIQEAAAAFSEGLNTTVNAAIEDFATGFAEALSRVATGGNILQSIFGAVFSTLIGVMEQVGKIAIQTGVALLGIKTAIKSLNPVAAIAAGTALILLSKVIRSGLSKVVPAFAEGGLVSGPTLALVGDNPNARADPEVISPLSKLKQIIGDTQRGVPYIASARVSGNDLLILIEQAQAQRQR